MLPACLPSVDPCTLPPRNKKPRWWPLLSHLSAFNISPRLPIVCDSPVLLPSFGSPHSPEISFSHSPARVPQGWVACHCLLLSILFLVPSLKKLSKHHHTRPCCAPKLLLAEVWGRGRECGQHVLLGLSLHWPPTLPQEAEKPLWRGGLVVAEQTHRQKSRRASTTAQTKFKGNEPNRVAAWC